MGKLAIDLAKLTAGEKLDLIDDLWRSLSPDELPLTTELRAELDRRLDRLELLDIDTITRLFNAHLGSDWPKRIDYITSAAGPSGRSDE